LSPFKQWEKPPINWCRISSIHCIINVHKKGYPSTELLLRSSLHITSLKPWPSAEMMLHLSQVPTGSCDHMKRAGWESVMVPVFPFFSCKRLYRCAKPSICRSFSCKNHGFSTSILVYPRIHPKITSPHWVKLAKTSPA
jgi:hypothetical protein